MKNTKTTAESYISTTAKELLKRIESKFKGSATMPLVYICSPYSGDIESNTAKAQAHCRFAIDSGYIPIAMHLLLPQFMDDNIPEERDLALFMDLLVMGKCQEVWVFGDVISEGMAIELEKARLCVQKIRYFNDNYKEIRND